MEKKRILTAMISTLLFLTESGLAPFFWSWYESKLPEGVKSATFLWVLVMFSIGQMGLILYLWARSFDSNMK